MSNTNLVDNQFVEELQSLLDALNSDNVMDCGVLDGFLTGCLLNPQAISLEKALPLIFDPEGNPEHIPQNDRLLLLIDRRYHQIAAALQAGAGLDPIIFPVVDDQGNPVTTKESASETIEPWAAGFFMAVALWDDGVETTVESSLLPIACHVSEDMWDDEAGISREDLKQARDEANNLEEALYNLVEAVFTIKQTLRPNLPHKNATPKVGRNDSCPCGSGKKYKQCCGRAH